VTLDDTYDFTSSRLSFGYVMPIDDNLDVIFDVSYDALYVDFGSLAGENFDLDDDGYGSSVGIRWNPVPVAEVFASVRASSIGEVVLEQLRFDSDISARAGVRWYCFEGLGLGVDYEAAQTDTVSFSVRFSFGNLPW